MLLIDVGRTAARNAPPRAAAVLDGNLVVIEVGKEQSGYRAREFRPGAGFEGRAFRCVKAFGGTDAAKDAYSAFVSADGHGDECGCRGFARHRRCKHLDALRGLIAAGATFAG